MFNDEAIYTLLKTFITLFVFRCKHFQKLGERPVPEKAEVCDRSHQYTGTGLRQKSHPGHQ